MKFDVAIVGGGPGGATCAAFCAASGLRVVLIEREKFPREKVCGDCLNPDCWPILRRLELEGRVRSSAHAPLEWVEFINLRGQSLRVSLPAGAEIAIKRSIFDALLMQRARELGAEVREETTLTAIARANDSWTFTTAEARQFSARVLIAADGRNSTVARLLGLFPRAAKERVALQAHVPLRHDFGNRIVLQWLPGGYSGQAPVNERELNVCLVGRAKTIRALRDWATQRFALDPSVSWRTITPLTRAVLPAARENLLLVGDAARVVEPFTGEGIYYAMRSGELAAAAAGKIVQGNFAETATREYGKEHAAIYRGRLWINALARAAVVSPRVGSIAFSLARLQPALLHLLTRKIASSRAEPRDPVAKA